MHQHWLYRAKKLWIPLFTIGGLFFVVNFFYSQSGSLNNSVHLTPSYVLLTILLQIIYWIAGAHCWRSIVNVSSGRKIGLLQSLNHLAVVSLGKYFPGKVWGMFARISMMKEQGITYKQSVQATMHEQFLTLHSSAIISAAFAFVLFPSIIATISLALALASIFLIRPLQQFGISIVHRFSRKMPSDQLLPPQIPNFRQNLSLLLNYCMIWIFVGCIFCSIYFALFPATPSWPIIFHLVLANTIGITLGFFALFAPGGLGVREAITSGLLATQMPFSDALLLALASRFWFVVSEMLTGILLLISHKRGQRGSTP